MIHAGIQTSKICPDPAAVTSYTIQEQIHYTSRPISDVCMMLQNLKKYFKYVSLFNYAHTIILGFTASDII